MSTYYLGSGLTYQQYLQAKSFVSDVTDAQQKAAKAVNLSVARQTRELIASQEALARENIRAIGKVAQATQEGFEQLSWEIQDVGRGISEINATFQWGFGEMLSQMSRLNSAVSELVKLAKTPVQTEANEHFQIARDAFRRRLYGDALEEVEKAIAKYKLEWRYYSLAGTIRLGSVSGGLEFLDLGKAEECFLLAGKYAESDNPEDAARACLAASWAAYCQGKSGVALKHAEQAIALHPHFAEALFQAGKVYMALRDPESALSLLGKAIDLDKRYALKAAADGDFQRYQPELHEFLEALRQEKVRQIRPAIEEALKRYDFWLSRSEEAREDPLFKKARSFVASDAMPLWDLLEASGDLGSLPSALAERASKVRFLSRSATPGLEYEVQETYIEEPPPGSGLFRRLSGPKERTRRVKKSGEAEVIAVHDATGAVTLRLQFAMVPPGSFTWYREYPSGEGEWQSVRLSNPMLVSVTPITVGQYHAVLQTKPPNVSELSKPVVNVSWYDAVNYCNALSRELGLQEAYAVSPRGVKWRGVDNTGYRLLTDAEWHYACFGSLSSAMSPCNSWTADEIDKVAWVKANSNGAIHPVALKSPNEWGLYDMLGNVFEWLFDWYLMKKPWWGPWKDLNPVCPTGDDDVDASLLATLSRGAESPLRYVAGQSQAASVLRAARGATYLAEDQFIRGGAPAIGADPSNANSPTFSAVSFRIARTAAH